MMKEIKFMNIPAVFIGVLIILSLFFACDNDDSFSSNANLRLSFSADTVRFDTVFSTIGTSTKRVKVYNRNKDGIRINTIELLNADKSGFRMNVDGISGNNINDVEILGNDSLYIFVEVTVDPLNKNNPVLVDDVIRFQFNGTSQDLRLEAIAQDVVIFRNKYFDADTTLTGEKPFLVYGDLTVKESTVLNIQENVSLLFHDKAKLAVEGSIKATGTIDKPIVFRGDRMDYLYQSGNVPFDRVPGQWGGIEIAEDSYDNTFENARIRNSIYGVLCHESEPSKQKATFKNTIIQNTSKEGLWAVNCKITAQNSLFANSGGYTVKLLGGLHDFLHCTIANYIDGAWGFVPYRGSLYLSNVGENTKGDKVNHSLTNASFTNTIVSGKGSSELKLENANSGLEFNHLFTHCLIKNKGSDDANFVNTVWNVDPQFKYIYSYNSADENTKLYYTYDYQLTDGSPAINKGSRQSAVNLPTDIIGASRRTDDAPDIGCFEWIKK